MSAKFTPGAMRAANKILDRMESSLRLSSDEIAEIISRETAIPKALELLQDAADKLQDYSAEAYGDLNDGLATDIYAFLEKTLKR
jgi:hypothetical protein